MTAVKHCRTVFWIYGFQVGGAERQALAFARHLQQSGWTSVEIWGFENDGPIRAQCDEASIPTRVLPIWSGRTRRRDLAWTAIRAARALRAARVDLVLPYMTPSNIACGLGWRLSGARACVWNQRNAGMETMHHGAETLAARLSSALVANSARGADFLVNTLRARPDRVFVIPNPVLLSLPRVGGRTWRERLGAEGSSFVVTMTANLNRWKDHETLLRAWSHVCREWQLEGTRPVLALAGQERETAPAVRDLARELGITDRIAFLGLVDDVAGLLAASDAGVLLSRYEDAEGCPNALIEYMAAGLPIVASDTAGPREALGHELRESLVTPGDDRAVADRLLSLASNPAVRADLGRAARSRADRVFSKEATFGRYAELLQAIVRQANR